MKKTRIDLTGQKFGRLAVLEYSHTDKRGGANWVCLCDCGRKKIIASNNLRSGNSTSCGCYHNELLSKREKTHGDTGSRLYWIWHGMKARCLNENDDAYSNYGGRGICVCDEWRDSYESFRDWAMNNGYNDRLTIDRVNVNEGYHPDNCRWATSGEQANNTRRNRYVTFNGKTQTIRQWADELGMSYDKLYSRIVKRKWDIDRAMSAE